MRNFSNLASLMPNRTNYSKIGFKSNNNEIKREENQTIVPNLSNMNTGTYQLQNNTLTISKEGARKTFSIKAPNQKTMMLANLTENKNLPGFLYKEGKYCPTLEITDKDLGIKVTLIKGSEIKGDGFDIKMPGTLSLPDGKKHEIGFKGNLYVTTSYLEHRTRETINEYLARKLYKKVPTGDHSIKDGPNVLILGGGFGTRLQGYTGTETNKPSATMTGSEDYRVLFDSLDKASLVGALKTGGRIQYVSENHTISGDNVYHIPKPGPVGNGGGIAQGVEGGAISTDKPLLILNNDSFCNFDPTRLYKKYSELQDAAIVIPYFPIPEEKIDSFGLLATKVDDNGNHFLDEWIEEKDQKAQRASEAKIEGGGYKANPGIYMMNPRVVEYFKTMSGKKFNLNVFVNKVNEMCKNKIDWEGKPFPYKIYIVPMEARDGKKPIWDDLGTFEAMLNRSRDVGYRTLKSKQNRTPNPYYGFPQYVIDNITKNTSNPEKTGLDPDSIIYSSDSSREKLNKFKSKYGITKLNGNVYIQ